MRLGAFDPSMHSTGIAIFEDDILVDAGELKVPKSVTGVEAIIRMWYNWIGGNQCRTPFDEIAVEVQTWRGKNEKSKPQNMMDLQAVCCVFFCSVNSSRSYAYTPRDWKGTIPKVPHHKQLKARLPSGFKHVEGDALDAFGIGLHHIEKGRK